MNPQQIVALGLRFFAIFVAILSLRFLFSYPASVAGTNLEKDIYISHVIGGVCILSAFALWFFPMTFANKIVPRTKFENHIKVGALDAARVGCSLIGLWLLATSLPNILWFVFSTSMNIGVGDQSYMRSLTTQNKINFAFYLSELILGILLIFKSHIFAKFVMREEKEDEGGE